MNKIIIFIVFLLLMFVTTGTGLAATSDLSVKIETPKSYTKENNFKIGFVVLDLLGRPVTVKCLKKGPGESNFSQFGSDLTTGNGGNSGFCEVTPAVMPKDGDYQFKVSAQAGSDTVESPVVTVGYGTVAPSTPTSYSKEQLSSCDYKIKFKTADDHETTKVKIYRSTETNFIADLGSQVGTVSIGPNLEGSFTNVVPDCPKTYYFAIRAFDDRDNGSGIIGDSNVIVETNTVVISPTPSTLGSALVVTRSQVEEASVNKEATAPEGEVLGETSSDSQPQPTSATDQKSSSFRGLFTWRNLGLALIFASALFFLFYRRFSSK